MGPLTVADPEDLRRGLSQLDARDRRVVELRQGLGGESPHSLAEVGRLLGISRQRVHQLEKRALRAICPRPGVEPRARATPRAPALPFKGFLRPWTLLLLQLEPTHGYGLLERLERVGLTPTTGRIYRLLRHLEDEGHLRSTWASGNGVAPSRRICALTGKGTQQLRQDAQAIEELGQLLRRFSAYYGDLADRIEREREPARAQR